MAKKTKIYITSMHRWGDSESHNYLIYAGFSKSHALAIGLQEKEDRGGKYDYMVTEFTPDKPETRKIVQDVGD